jgi:hypothetical protein
MKLSSHLLLAAFLSFSAFSKAQAQATAWIAVKTNDSVVSSIEVKKFISNIVVTAEARKELFEKADKDYGKYKKELDVISENLFKDTTDQIAAVRLLQAEAIKSYDRKFFSISKNTMDGLVKINLENALRPFEKNGRNDEEVRNAFVESLKASGYPHEKSASNDEIYASWKAELKFQVKENYRQQEAMKFLCALGDCQSVGALKVFNNYKKQLAKKHFLAINYGKENTLKGEEAYAALFVSDIHAGSTAPQSADASKDIDYYVGKVTGQKVELIHVNDFNALGALGTAIGYPDTDDEGRTSAFILRRQIEGTKGSVTVELENWLFSKELYRNDKGETFQNVEEESTLRIASRQFLDESGQKWIVIGISGTTRQQREGLGSWIQENFHKLNSSPRPKYNVDREGDDFYAQAILGLGGKYSILDSEHVDLVISGEVLLNPTIGLVGENSIKINSAIDLYIYRSNDDLPVVTLGAFANYNFKANGDIDTSIGGKLAVAHQFKKVRVEIALFIIKWESELDRTYEGGASWTSGLMLSAAFGPKKTDKDYEFNL